MDGMDTISPEQRLRIQSLIDGSLDPAEIASVNEELRQDPLLRGFYLDQMRMHQLLEQYHVPAKSLLVLDSPQRSRKKTVILTLSSVGLGIAATVLCMLWLGQVSPEPVSSPEQGT